MQRSLLALSATVWLLTGTGFSCAPTTLLPPLASSFPASGQTISPSEWPRATFSATVDPTSMDSLRVFCGGQPVLRLTFRLNSDTVVAQPFAMLPAGASCSLEIDTVNGLQSVAFQTSAAGGGFSTVHDRRNTDVPLPFPDDVFLTPDASQVTNLRPDFTGRLPIPQGSANLLIVSLANRAEASSDGWSPVGPISLQLSEAPDLSSLPLDRDASLDPLSSVALIDMTAGSTRFGQRVPFSLIPRSDTLAGQPTIHALVIQPGIALEPEGTYGLVVTDRVLSQGGQPLARSPFFELAAKNFQAGEDARIGETRALADDVMRVAERITPIAIPRTDVVLAARISVRSTDHFPNDVLAMRQDVLAVPPNVTISSVSADFDPDVAAIVRGTFDVPVWIGVSGLVNRDASGIPTATGTASVPFILALPAAAAVSGMAPTLMYQHGNPGSSEGEVPGAARSFLGGNGFAVGGFTDVLNRNFADVAEQQNAIFTQVLFGGGQAQDFYIQTYAEQIAFVQALKSMDSLDVLPIGAPDGVPDLDPSVLVYEGISYGSTHGSALMAYEPDIRAAAMVAGAGKLVELLEYQDRTLPLGGPRFLVESLPANLTAVRMPDLWMALQMFAISYDPQEPHNHARFIYQEPITVGGSTTKASMLVVEGVDDSFTANNATRSLARQLGGITQFSPALRVSDLPEQSTPVQANIDASTSAAMVQYVPAGSSVPASTGCQSQFEGHFCAQTAPEARAQRIRFYQSALTGTPVID